MATQRHRSLVLIGCFKLFKATFLVAAAFQLFSWMRHDVATSLMAWAAALHVDPDNRMIHTAFEKLLGVKRSTLRSFGIGAVLYALVFTTEGVGLLLAKRWAEYMTLGVTLSFLPIEGYELYAHPSVLKALTTLINLAVAIYLGVLLRTEAPRRRGTAI